MIEYNGSQILRVDDHPLLAIPLTDVATRILLKKAARADLRSKSG